MTCLGLFEPTHLHAIAMDISPLIRTDCWTKHGVRFINLSPQVRKPNGETLPYNSL